MKTPERERERERKKNCAIAIWSMHFLPLPFFFRRSLSCSRSSALVLSFYILRALFPYVFFSPPPPSSPSSPHAMELTLSDKSSRQNTLKKEVTTHEIRRRKKAGVQRKQTSTIFKAHEGQSYDIHSFERECNCSRHRFQCVSLHRCGNQPHRYLTDAVRDRSMRMFDASPLSFPRWERHRSCVPASENSMNYAVSEKRALFHSSSNGISIFQMEKKKAKRIIQSVH